MRLFPVRNVMLGLTAGFMLSGSLSACQTSQPKPAQAAIAVASPAALPSPDEPGADLVDAFGAFCLQQFPARMDLRAEARGPDATLTPLPPGEIRRFLHNDPGRGWIHKSARGLYVETLEDPPYRACAVRSIYNAPPEYLTMYEILLGAWAANNRRNLSSQEIAMPVPAGSAPTMGRARLVQASAGLPAEIMMRIETALPDGRREVRLVRQIPDPPVAGHR